MGEVPAQDLKMHSIRAKTSVGVKGFLPKVQKQQWNHRFRFSVRSQNMQHRGTEWMNVLTIRDDCSYVDWWVGRLDLAGLEEDLEQLERGRRRKDAKATPGHHTTFASLTKKSHQRTDRSAPVATGKTEWKNNKLLNFSNTNYSFEISLTHLKRKCNLYLFCVCVLSVSNRNQPDWTTCPRSWSRSPPFRRRCRLLHVDSG